MTGRQRIRMTRLSFARLLSELSALRSQRGVEVRDDFMDWRPSVRQARIREIEDLLATASIGEHSDAVAKAGMVLTIRYDLTGETETFLLGRRGAPDADVKVYSMLSPLGRAIAGARVGEQRSYAIPHGPEHRVTLVKAVPYKARVKT